MIGVVLAALVAKFLTPLFLYDVPLGYDPGMYRYLFVTYAESFKALSMPDLLPWAKEYPPGLFFLFSPLVALGFPVDALIGWVWNLVPVLLAVMLAWVTAKRLGTTDGIATLIIALLSIPYYDGFVGMYFKAYVALFFVVLTYHLAQKRSSWFLLTAFLTVITHQQTALILILALVSWWLLQVRSGWKDPWYRRITVLGLALVFAALLTYLPQWERAIWSPLKSIVLLRGDNAPGGAFPELSFYLQTTGVVLLLGMIGFFRRLREDRGSLWQISVLVCAVFIAFQLVFHKRFFLQLDFFLMPFAASALVWLWQLVRSVQARTLICVLLLGQAYVSVQIITLREPEVRRSTLDEIIRVTQATPDDASLIALENASGPWLRGWKVAGQVGAPGLFDYPGWSYDQWGQFIDGTQADRKVLLQTLSGDVYFFVSPMFSGFYGDRAVKVLEDPCLQKVNSQPLLHSTCSKN